MHAEFLPLKGKYYGTIIKITDDNGLEFEVRLWNSDSGVPSERELEGLCTVEQWENNELINYKDYEGSGQFSIVKLRAKEVKEICDSHYESRETYNAAVEIVNRINKFEKFKDLLS